MEPFIHLHVHTQYSLLDGQASIDALIDKAQKDGMNAIAVTDHGNMFGIKEFFNKNFDYQDIRNRRERMKRLRQDPYYNALQIKYAYAITCHKAQGGQWSRVFLDQGYTPADMLSLNYLRWLYTAFTRTTERLYLVNWPKNQRAETDEFDF